MTSAPCSILHSVLQYVRLDVKNCPIFSKVAQKVTKAVFTTTRFFQNVTKYAGNFCKKMCHPFSKIGQSGHTVYNPPSASFLLMLRFLNAYFCFYPAAASICWHLTASRYRSTLSNYDGLIDLHQKRD